MKKAKNISSQKTRPLSKIKVLVLTTLILSVSSRFSEAQVNPDKSIRSEEYKKYFSLDKTYKMCSEYLRQKPNWKMNHCCCEGDMYCRTYGIDISYVESELPNIGMNPLVHTDKFYIPDEVLEICAKRPEKRCFNEFSSIESRLENINIDIVQRCTEHLEHLLGTKYSFHFRGCMGSSGLIGFSYLSKVKTNNLSRCVASQLIKRSYGESHYGLQFPLDGYVEVTVDHSTMSSRGANYRDKASQVI